MKITCHSSKAFFLLLGLRIRRPDFSGFEEKKYILFTFFFFTNFQLSVTITDKGGGQINYGVQGTQELEPTDIAREETRHDDLLIVLSHNSGSRAEA